MIGGPGCAPACTEVELPLGSEVEIDGGNDLLLLLRERIEVADGSQAAVVLESDGDSLREVVAELAAGRELPSDVLRRPAEERRGRRGPSLGELRDLIAEAERRA